MIFASLFGFQFALKFSLSVSVHVIRWYQIPFLVGAGLWSPDRIKSFNNLPKQGSTWIYAVVFSINEEAWLPVGGKANCILFVWVCLLYSLNATFQAQLQKARAFSAAGLHHMVGAAFTTCNAFKIKNIHQSSVETISRKVCTEWGISSNGASSMINLVGPSYPGKQAPFRHGVDHFHTSASLPSHSHFGLLPQLRIFRKELDFPAAASVRLMHFLLRLE
jgi:hypothetical protein